MKIKEQATKESAPSLATRIYGSLPYGVYVCADGREVLFNRGYQPIWERSPGQRATPADAHEWIGFTDQRWFIARDTMPRTARGRDYKRLLRILAGFLAGEALP